MNKDPPDSVIEHAEFLRLQNERHVHRADLELDGNNRKERRALKAAMRKKNKPMRWDDMK